MELYRYGESLLLPSVPDYNHTVYGHSYIAPNAVAEGYHALFISDKPFTYDTANNVIVPADGATVMRCAYTGEDWGEFVETDAAKLLVAQWCNVTILNTEGEEFLLGSEPVRYVPAIIITHEVTVDLSVIDVPELIHAVQTDEYSRDIRFIIKNNGEDFNIPAGATVAVAFSKADGHGGSYDTLPDGTAAGTINGNTVTVKLAPQVLTATGKTWVSIILTCGNSTIHTFRVMISVQPNPGLQAVSANYFKVAGALADSGWEPGKYLGTDENGNVVPREATTYTPDTVTAIFITEAGDGTITMVNTLDKGSETIVISADSSGSPNKVTYNGMEIPISWGTQ